jgi:hypothetical protein
MYNFLDPCRRADRGRGPDRPLPPGRVTVVRPTRVANRIRALRFSSGQMTQGELAVPLEEVFRYPGTGS